jgi:hypothetical protein
VVRTYDGQESVGDEKLYSLTQLAALGKSVAPSIIGEAILRKLATMHPDVLAPLFPSLAPPALSGQ